MKPEQRLQQTLSLKQQMNTVLLQSLKILQMSTEDLVSAVQETVLGNPLLEWDTSWKSREQFEAVGHAPVNESITAQSAAGPKDLLRDQLVFAGLDARTRQFAEIFIDSLNDRGYLPEGVATWRAQFACPQDLLQRILTALGDFAPGIGSKNLPECLLAQTDPEDRLLQEIIAEDLALVAAKDLTTLADTYEVTTEEIEDRLDRLRAMHPYPFFQLGEGQQAPPTPPDAVLLWQENRWQIELFDEVLPSVTVDLHALDHLLGHAEADTFIKEKVQEAQQLLFSIRERNATMIRALHAITEKQTAYLRGLSQAPQPFLQKELAEILDVHPSTISRTIRNKRIQTPRGLIDLDTCFARPLTEQGNYTADSLMKDIQKMQAAYPKASDRVLTEKLNAMGVPVKRRTVNKYRNLLRNS